ncbi:glycosyltransferase family 4 protein [Halorubellus sp. JP-L1]|uniref:glycosyltransferase n=1 Tax=Halorubellus sp. JP-L1 TaxID=2715753 RepID=UPI00140C13BE|nr:glycosyltransferase [Halorubellus sp. JP-L1]NHN43192.1 glycosyltransferase family 4 protein [Halorubellus sp. JP-L1]
MRVLKLVTNDEAEFFRTQVESIRRQGVDVDVLPVPGQRVATDDRTESRSIANYLRYYPQVLRASFGDYDVLHAHYGLTAPAAIAQPNLPVVVSYWGSDVMGSMRPVSRFCSRFADETIVVSAEMAEIVGGDPHVVPHGIDMDVFRPFDGSVARDVVGWRQDAKHVLFPYAKQRPVKDYPRAERVVEAVRERFARTPLTVDAGPGAASTGAGMEVELHSLHDVAHHRMPLYLNAADAVLMTSKTEGSPNAVKEALSCNVPVVSTDVGDVAELVDGVENANVADTDEGLADALADVLERGEPSTGRTAIEPLSVDRIAERICGIYDEVVA